MSIKIDAPEIFTDDEAQDYLNNASNELAKGFSTAILPKPDLRIMLAMVQAQFATAKLLSNIHMEVLKTRLELEQLKKKIK